MKKSRYKAAEGWRERLRIVLKVLLEEESSSMSELAAKSGLSYPTVYNMVHGVKSNPPCVETLQKLSSATAHPEEWYTRLKRAVVGSYSEPSETPEKAENCVVAYLLKDGVTQIELATKVGVTQATISRWAANSVVPKSAAMQKLLSLTESQMNADSSKDEILEKILENGRKLSTDKLIQLLTISESLKGDHKC